MRILQNNRLRFRLQADADVAEVFVRGLLLTDDGIQYPIAMSGKATAVRLLHTVSEIELPVGELMWISAAFANDKYTSFQRDRTYVSIELLSRAAQPEVSGTPLLSGWITDGAQISWPGKQRGQYDRPKPWVHMTRQVGWALDTTPKFIPLDYTFERIRTIQMYFSNSALQSSQGNLIVRQNIGSGFTIHLGMINWNIQASATEVITIQCGIESGSAIPEPGQQFEYLPALGSSPGDNLRLATPTSVTENVTLDHIIITGIGVPVIRYPNPTQ